MRTITLEEPENIKKLPHFRGLPITAITFVGEDGTPNFKVIDNEKVRDCKDNKKCAICGQPLGWWIAFMVSEKEAQTRFIFESPNHEECLRYAFELCPWLYYSKAKYSDPETVKADGMGTISSHPDRSTINERPEKLGLYLCRGYDNVIHRGFRVCKVPPAKKLEWFEGH
jgi:hypothetical protein